MRSTVSIVLLSLLAACGGNPCDEYVDYLCECDEENCDSLKTTYENADSEVQDECSAQLDEAEELAETCADAGGSDSEGDESEE
jgi:hypothetical protein